MEIQERQMFQRCELLLGSEAFNHIQQQKVIIFGVGGVGSWCAESLIRSGIKDLTIVDTDDVSPTNINRQLLATTATVGRVKVEAMKERLLEINPNAHINALHKMYSRDNNHEFQLEQYDYIIDCIDALKDKAALLINATNGTWCEQTPLVEHLPQQPFCHAKVFSSMGAALKIDPTQVRVAEYWKVRGCPLGAAIRKKMKRAKQKLGKPVMCVYSEELLDNKGITDETCDYKAVINGTLAHITAIFGFTLAGLVIKDIVEALSATEEQSDTLQ